MHNRQAVRGDRSLQIPTQDGTQWPGGHAEFQEKWPKVVPLIHMSTKYHGSYSQIHVD
jgi:hypothetical protein